MKKITILVLAVSFLLAVTSGCGIGSNDLKDWGLGAFNG